MGAVADAMALLGCSDHEYREAREFGDDFEAAWNGCRCGTFTAWLLRRIGFSWERVSGVVYDALEDDHREKVMLKSDIGGFTTPEAAHNLVMFFCRLIDDQWQRCANDASRAVAEAYRDAFAFEKVREALSRALEDACESVSSVKSAVV